MCLCEGKIYKCIEFFSNSLPLNFLEDHVINLVQSRWLNLMQSSNSCQNVYECNIITKIIVEWHI
jgi:hypothetical protein